MLARYATHAALPTRLTRSKKAARFLPADPHSEVRFADTRGPDSAFLGVR